MQRHQTSRVRIGLIDSRGTAGSSRRRRSASQHGVPSCLVPAGVATLQKSRCVFLSSGWPRDVRSRTVVEAGARGHRPATTTRADNAARRRGRNRPASSAPFSCTSIRKPPAVAVGHGNRSSLRTGFVLALTLLPWLGCGAAESDPTDLGGHRYAGHGGRMRAARPAPAAPRGAARRRAVKPGPTGTGTPGAGGSSATPAARGNIGTTSDGHGGHRRYDRRRRKHRRRAGRTAGSAGTTGSAGTPGGAGTPGTGGAPGDRGNAGHARSAADRRARRAPPERHAHRGNAGTPESRPRRARAGTRGTPGRRQRRAAPERRAPPERRPAPAPRAAPARSATQRGGSHQERLRHRDGERAGRRDLRQQERAVSERAPRQVRARDRVHRSAADGDPQRAPLRLDGGGDEQVQRRDVHGRLGSVLRQQHEEHRSPHDADDGRDARPSAGWA